MASEEADSFYRKGLASLSMGSLSHAIQCLTQSLSQRKASSAFYARGLAKERSGDFYGAVSDYDEAIRAAPAYVTAHLRKAKTLRKMGDLKAAIEAAQKGAEGEKGDHRCRLLFAVLLQIASRYEQSIDQCSLILNTDESVIDAYLVRARALEEDNEWLRAERDVRGALRLAPHHPLAILFLGRCHLFRRKDWRQAEQTLRLLVPFRRMASIKPLEATYGPYGPLVEIGPEELPKGLAIADEKGERPAVPDSVALPALAIYARAHAVHGETARAVMEVREVLRSVQLQQSDGGDGGGAAKRKVVETETWWSEAMVSPEEELETTLMSLLLSSNRIDEAVKEGEKTARRETASSATLLLFAEALSRKGLYQRASEVLDEARSREKETGRVRTWGESQTSQRLAALRDRMRGEGF